MKSLVKIKDLNFTTKLFTLMLNKSLTWTNAISVGRISSPNTFDRISTAAALHLRKFQILTISSSCHDHKSSHYKRYSAYQNYQPNNWIRNQQHYDAGNYIFFRTIRSMKPRWMKTRFNILQCKISALSVKIREEKKT